MPNPFGSTGSGESSTYRAPSTTVNRGQRLRTVNSAGKISVDVSNPTETIAQSANDMAQGLVGVGKGLVSIAENLPVVGIVAKPVIGGIGSIADATIGKVVGAIEKSPVGGVASGALGAVGDIGMGALELISAPGRFAEQKVAEARIRSTQEGRYDPIRVYFGDAPAAAVNSVRGGASIEDAALQLANSNAGFSENGAMNFLYSLVIDPLNLIAPGAGKAVAIGAEAATLNRIGVAGLKELAAKATKAGLKETAQGYTKQAAFLEKWGLAAKVYEETLGKLDRFKRNLTSNIAKESATAYTRVYAKGLTAIDTVLSDIGATVGLRNTDQGLRNVATTFANAIKSSSVRARAAIVRSNAKDFSDNLVTDAIGQATEKKTLQDFLATELAQGGNVGDLLKRLEIPDEDVAKMFTEIQGGVASGLRAAELRRTKAVSEVRQKIEEAAANARVRQQKDLIRATAEYKAKADARLASEDAFRVLSEAKLDRVPAATDTARGIEELASDLAAGFGIKDTAARQIAEKVFKENAGDIRTLTDVLAFARDAAYGQAVRELAAIRKAFKTGDFLSRITITSTRSLTESNSKSLIERVSRLEKIVKASGKGYSGIPESATKTKISIKPPSEDTYEVLNANFLFGKVDGNKNVDIDSINGTIDLSQPSEVRRVEQLASNISSENGFISRIIIDDLGNVIEGQHRLEAMRMLGETSIPVVVIRNLENYYDIPAMEKAVRSVANLRQENVAQLVKEAVNAIEESGSASAAISNYRMPAELQPAFEAAIKASGDGSAASKTSSKLSEVAKAELKQISDNLVRQYDEFGVFAGSDYTYSQVLDFLKKSQKLTVREITSKERAIIKSRVKEGAVKQLTDMEQRLLKYGYRLGIAPEDTISTVRTMVVDHNGRETFTEMVMPFSDTLDHVAIKGLDDDLASVKLRPSKLSKVWEKLTRPYGVEVTKNNIAERFVSSMVQKTGVSVNTARRLMSRITDLAAEKGIQPKALYLDRAELDKIFKQEMGDVAYGRLFESGTTPIKEVVSAAAGDWSVSGLTSGFTGRVKAIFPEITVLTDRFYPDLRFGRLNPFFNLVMERVETKIQLAVYGIKREVAEASIGDIRGTVLRKAHLNPASVHHEINDGVMRMQARAVQNTSVAIEASGGLKSRVSRLVRPLFSKGTYSIDGIKEAKEIARDIMSDQFAVRTFMDTLEEVAPGKIKELAEHYGVTKAEDAIELLLADYLIQADPFQFAKYIKDQGGKARTLTVNALTGNSVMDMPTIVKLVAEDEPLKQQLRKVLDRTPIGQLLPGGWNEGGCLIFAEAARRKFGGNLIGFYEYSEDARLYNHVAVVLDDGRILDANGIRSIDDAIADLEKNGWENVEFDDLVDLEDLKSDIAYSESLVKNLFDRSNQVTSMLPFNQAQDIAAATMAAYELAIQRASRAADKAQYFASHRSWFERSINHPFLGLYPYSYMTQKAIPSLLRIMFVPRIGGVVAPGLGYAKWENVLEWAENNVNSDEDVINQLLQNDALIYLASTLLPVTPDNSGFSMPTWLRRGIIQPGLRGDAIKLGDIGQTMTEVGAQFVRGTVLGQGRTVLEGIEGIDKATRANERFSGFIQSQSDFIQEKVLELRGQ